MLQFVIFKSRIYEKINTEDTEDKDLQEKTVLNAPLAQDFTYKIINSFKIDKNNITNGHKAVCIIALQRPNYLEESGSKIIIISCR